MLGSSSVVSIPHSFVFLSQPIWVVFFSLSNEKRNQNIHPMWVGRGSLKFKFHAEKKFDDGEISLQVKTFVLPFLLRVRSFEYR